MLERAGRVRVALVARMRLWMGLEGCSFGPSAPMTS